MDIFNNCRICLQEINHEPIKMTRIILKFIEFSLQMKNVTKPSCPTNVKQNLCAGCFNKLSEFQDFHELCKDADEFWKSQFEQYTKGLCPKAEEEDMHFDDAELIVVPDDNTSNDPETNIIEMPFSNVQQDNDEEEEEIKQEKEDEQQQQQQQKIILPTPSPIPDDDDDDEELEENPQIEHFEGTDLKNWPDDDENDNNHVNNIQNIEHAENEGKFVNDEIIEYEYQIDQGGGGGDDELEPVQDDATISAIHVMDDYPNNTYEDETGDISSNEGALIQESLDGILVEDQVEDIVEDQVEDQVEVTKNTFFMETTMDESGKMKMTYKCQYCDKSFNRVYDIESHYNIHYDVKPYTCGVCGKSFRQKNTLNTHQAIHFGKKVECTDCGKKFARKSQLILHNRMHRDEKPFVCDFEGCTTAFRQRQHLLDHWFVHTGEKNFQCATCSKSFHTRKRLQDHIYKVHSQHRYRCNLCEKQFLKPYMLKNHMATAHNVEIDDVSHLKKAVEPTVKKTTKKKS